MLHQNVLASLSSLKKMIELILIFDWFTLDVSVFGVFAVCCSDLLDLAGECLVIFGLNETVKGNMLLAECKRGNLAVCIIHKMIYVFKSKAFLCYNQNFLVWGCFAKFLRSGMMLKFLNQAVFEFNFYCKICCKNLSQEKT